MQILINTHQYLFVQLKHALMAGMKIIKNHHKTQFFKMVSRVVNTFILKKLRKTYFLDKNLFLAG
jgi:hypothetical protein